MNPFDIQQIMMSGGDVVDTFRADTVGTPAGFVNQAKFDDRNNMYVMRTKGGGYTAPQAQTYPLTKYDKDNNHIFTIYPIDTSVFSGATGAIKIHDWCVVPTTGVTYIALSYEASSGTYLGHAWLIKISSTGVREWVQYLPNDGANIDGYNSISLPVYKVACDRYGNVFYHYRRTYSVFVGYDGDDNPVYSSTTQARYDKINSSGGNIWSRSVDVLLTEYMWMFCDPAGDLYLVTNNNSNDFGINKIDGTTGTQVWSRNGYQAGSIYYNRTGSGSGAISWAQEMRFNGICFAPDGTIYLTGTNNGVFVISKVNPANGNVIYSKNCKGNFMSGLGINIHSIFVIKTSVFVYATSAPYTGSTWYGHLAEVAASDLTAINMTTFSISSSGGGPVGHFQGTKSDNMEFVIGNNISGNVISIRARIKLPFTVGNSITFANTSIPVISTSTDTVTLNTSYTDSSANAAGIVMTSNTTLLVANTTMAAPVYGTPANTYISSNTTFTW